MTNQQNHPITPPPELIEKWHSSSPLDRSLTVATQAARWGADQELEACCEFLNDNELCDPNFHKDLRAARRPKPPNKKQRGLTALEATNLKKNDPLLYQEILNAIEGLPND